MRTVVAALRSVAAYVGVSLYVAVTAPLGIALALIFRWKAILYIFGHGGVINHATVQAASVDAVPAVEDEVNNILDARHRIRSPATRDFEVQSLTSAIATSNQILQILTLFTAAVATISLVVGAIGILNIMLVSVTERTREIGIRKAIGATSRAILEQFLIRDSEE